MLVGDNTWNTMNIGQIIDSTLCASSTFQSNLDCSIESDDINSDSKNDISFSEDSAFENDNTQALVTVGKRRIEEIIASLSPLPSEQIADKQQFWTSFLAKNNIKHVVAPMVDQSELAFRMLLRKHNAHLAYSPMIHAHLFATNATYRASALSSCPADRPLIVQFCANNADALLAACTYVEHMCDGVDLNLGCPQIIAKRGHYGAFLQEERELVCDMIRKVRNYCTLPISVKIRVLESRTETTEYAQQLAEAGASLMTVHGRTREMKGANTGLADWSRIKDVVDAVSIPVFANGNIQCYKDVSDCLLATGAQGVMAAEGILTNPFLFEDEFVESWKIAAEYLEYAKEYSAEVSAIRAHLFKICHHSLIEFNDLRQMLATVYKFADFVNVVNVLKDRTNELLQKEENVSAMTLAKIYFRDISVGARKMEVKKINATPHWIAKPYFRPGASKATNEAVQKMKSAHKQQVQLLAEKYGLSYKQVRKRERRAISLDKAFSVKVKYVLCTQCKQPASQKCVGMLCKMCCKKKSSQTKTPCKAHRISGPSESNSLHMVK